MSEKKNDARQWTALDIQGLWCDDISFCPEQCRMMECPRNSKNIRDRFVPHSYFTELPPDCPKEMRKEEISMGCVKTITKHHFPNQSSYVNQRCEVCFHYDTSEMVGGTIVRDDLEEPFETLIQLDNGHIVRGVECQYSIKY